MPKVASYDIMLQSNASGSVTRTDLETFLPLFESICILRKKNVLDDAINADIRDGISIVNRIVNKTAWQHLNDFVTSSFADTLHNDSAPNIYLQECGHHGHYPTAFMGLDQSVYERERQRKRAFEHEWAKLQTTARALCEKIKGLLETLETERSPLIKLLVCVLDAYWNIVTDFILGWLPCERFMENINADT